MNMVICDEKSCPSCGGNLKHYDCVKRIVRTKKRITKRIRIQRLRCESCGSLHRELPNSVFPYKQYESEVIIGVLENLITSDTLGFEDYPCEMTMFRWKTSKRLRIFVDSRKI